MLRLLGDVALCSLLSGTNEARPKPKAAIQPGCPGGGEADLGAEVREIAAAHVGEFDALTW